MYTVDSVFAAIAKPKKTFLFFQTKLFDLVLVQRKKHSFSFFFVQTKTARILVRKKQLLFSNRLFLTAQLKNISFFPEIRLVFCCEAPWLERKEGRTEGRGRMRVMATYLRTSVASFACVA